MKAANVGCVYFLQEGFAKPLSDVEIRLQSYFDCYSVGLVPLRYGLSEAQHVEPPQVLEVEIGRLLAHDLGQKVRKLVEATDDPQVAQHGEDGKPMALTLDIPQRLLQRTGDGLLRELRPLVLLGLSHIPDAVGRVAQRVLVDDRLHHAKDATLVRLVDCLLYTSDAADD